MRIGSIGLAVLLLCGAVRAEVKTATVKYKAGDVEAQSFVAWDDAVTGKRPGVVIVPEWWGLNDYAKTRAKQLAQLGYVAFAADVYGNGQVTEDPKEAGKLAGALKGGDRKELRIRVVAALQQLKANPNVDPAKTAAIGYCFGGTTALELARSGADVAAVVSFHGDLSISQPAQPGEVKAKVLVNHGADDAFEPQEQIVAFQDEMRKAHADWQMNIYANAVHSFTNPGADKHGIPGIAYNKEADRRSWQAMLDLFHEVFGTAPSPKP
ncbi:MAG: dienelactone hydrolase [Phycisphaerales bacterium]|nr:dienelactone hydrolase [Phycisphaerales bacterium]MDB5300708.1 dienelactone hydrolase [Phycisphaerales bacterium]MDB5302651.1 dienelactone hydrolase [Phycisphaerales bacterium]